ncbi:MAG: filamentous hemagglutinin N-terminal domain-containing protein, partial [Selenomonas sp.]|nr:filamentous hemagglutinin N-terminal domain-containing protein [Selenomonas sp.]
MSRRKYRTLSLAVAAGLMMGAVGLFQPVAYARGGGMLPTGGVSATAAIASDGRDMTVDGQAARNVIAWDSFSIGQGNSVTFGGTYDYLNYVKGNSLSEIYGTMSGGGNIYLVNPNGIIFGESASI